MTPCLPRARRIRFLRGAALALIVLFAALSAVFFLSPTAHAEEAESGVSSEEEMWNNIRDLLEKLDVEGLQDYLDALSEEQKEIFGQGNMKDRILSLISGDFRADYSIGTSARTGQGLAELKAALLEILRRDQIYIERLYSFEEAWKLQLIRSRGQLISEEYLPEGVSIKAYVPGEIYGKL